MGFFDAICPDCNARAFNVWSGICKACGYDNNIGITSRGASHGFGSKKSTSTRKSTSTSNEGEEGEAPSEEDRWW
jgi:hypothetical protein